MNSASEPQPGPLAEFLRQRRALVTPDELNLPSYGQRRVPGLRREELAQLAGVSHAYYTRLEQGQVTTASQQVLIGIANALALSDDERDYLFSLIRPLPTRGPTLGRSLLSPGIRGLLTAMPDVPTVVLDRTTAILAWNPLGQLLVAPHYPFDAPDMDSPSTEHRCPSMARMLFLDHQIRSMHSQWIDEARQCIASLRLVAAQFHDDRDLNLLIGELSVKSPEFAEIWAEHGVARCTSGVKHYDHPLVGPISVAFEVLHSPDTKGQRILTHTGLTPRDTRALAALAEAGAVSTVETALRPAGDTP